jgi:hypothetical protein
MKLVALTVMGVTMIGPALSRQASTNISSSPSRPTGCWAGYGNCCGQTQVNKSR